MAEDEVHDEEVTHEGVTVEVPVRYRDLDTLGHVNNAVYVTYLEQGRAAFFDEVVPEFEFPDAPFVIASLECSFERAIGDADRVTVEVVPAEIGRTSLTLAYEIRTAETLAATARTVQVFVDAESRDPEPVPDRLRERLTAGR